MGLMKPKPVVLGSGDKVISAGIDRENDTLNVLITKHAKRYKIGELIENAEFFGSVTGLECELVFTNYKALDTFIDALEEAREQWLPFV